MNSKQRLWLKKRRNERKLTFLEIAKLLNMSKQGYWSIEAGIRNPSVTTAKKIARLLDFDWTIFLTKVSPFGDECIDCSLKTREGEIKMENLVIMKDQQAITTSLQVAETFGKRHDLVLRDIDNLIGSLKIEETQKR